MYIQVTFQNYTNHLNTKNPDLVLQWFKEQIPFWLSEGQFSTSGPVRIQFYPESEAEIQRINSTSFLPLNKEILARTFRDLADSLEGPSDEADAHSQV